MHREKKEITLHITLNFVAHDWDRFIFGEDIYLIQNFYEKHGSWIDMYFID